MNRGLYTAALGMTTQMNKMDVVSNNIANVNTTGYKRDDVVTRSFDEEMMLRLYDKTDEYYTNRRVGTMNMGVTVDNVYTNFTSGSLQSTNNPLDFALSGDGFFVIETYDNQGNAQERYTRDGRFTISEDYKLVTVDGYYVLDENGDKIDLGASTTINVSENGDIYSKDEPLAKMQIVSFEDNEYLRKEGDNLYYALDGANINESKATVSQGFTEGSNVNTVSEMVEMIVVSRAYEANQKVITTYDEIMSKSASEIARKY